MRLQVELTLLGRYVYMRVLYMDKGFLRYGNGYVAKNQMSVNSCDVPELTRGEVFLWGKRDNNRRVNRNFNTQAEAKRYYKELIEALEDFSVNYQGFSKDSKPERSVDYRVTYEHESSPKPITVEIHTF